MLTDPTPTSPSRQDAPSLLPGHPYAAFLDRVEKPARYAGGEVGARVKDWSAVEARFCLAFPDVYDIGMSHLGFKILYKLLNDDPRTLAERCYCPWVDLEAELRARSLPLVSLETARPLRDFDVVGFSLQYELTYSNLLTMLELGGIPLRSVDRGEDAPLIVAGGPTATHPEPLALFIDAFVIGDGEEKATEIALTWTRLRKEGVARAERLVALARLGAVYVPSLYPTHVDADTGLVVVDRPTLEGVPYPIVRSIVDLDLYPFPDDGPTGGPEAIFDRMSIEIARGCTEGCRFCQAGMIYRPVRERDPEQIVETVLSAVKHAGQDEVSLTALSTADVSCISPLVKTVARSLAEQRISLGISSLRAYGLEPELLDELKQVRATGLTFAPEAGTQRMRDVVNKNVTEEQLLETAERVFSRGWAKMKLYFMIGLPTETDEDVLGIVETAGRTAQVGRRAARGRADITASVSTHVPKPHTPFQWCAMDTLAEVTRKQRLLMDAGHRYRAVKLRTHDPATSVLEGVFARGDRPLADVLERAWKGGARFDSWDDHLRLGIWNEAFEALGIDKAKYLGTLPVTARLPWDHIDVGLQEGFLAKEYRKALQNRLSPPCGKVAGTFVHHTTLEDAEADARRLVCYDCGIACDLTAMRADRIVRLSKLDAHKRLPVVVEEPQPASPPPAEPIEVADALDPAAEGEPAVPPVRKKIPPPVRRGHAVRLRFEKKGAMALLGHLDIVREIPRIFRRVGEPLTYSIGFHPKPEMSFAPALSLGVVSLDEYADLRLERVLDPAALAALVDAMNAHSPAGLVFRDAVALAPGDPSVGKAIAGARYVLAFARSALEAPGGVPLESWLAERCRAALEATTLPVRRNVDGLGKVVDVRAYLERAEVGGAEARAALDRAGICGDLVTLDIDVAITGSGAVKSSEVAAVLVGEGGVAPPHRAVRVELYARDRGLRLDPIAAVHARRRAAAAPTATLEPPAAVPPP